MQAQDSSEGKKSKKSRQYPTPPTRSKASRLGIRKEFIDFLLDHDVSKLTFVDSRKLAERWRHDAFAQMAIPKTYAATFTSPIAFFPWFSLSVRSYMLLSSPTDGQWFTIREPRNVKCLSTSGRRCGRHPLPVLWLKHMLRVCWFVISRT